MGHPYDNLPSRRYSAYEPHLPRPILSRRPRIANAEMLLWLRLEHAFWQTDLMIPCCCLARRRYRCNRFNVCACLHGSCFRVVLDQELRPQMQHAQMRQGPAKELRAAPWTLRISSTLCICRKSISEPQNSPSALWSSAMCYSRPFSKNTVGRGLLRPLTSE